MNEGERDFVAGGAELIDLFTSRLTEEDACEA
jgi:hypothetical protein